MTKERDYALDNFRGLIVLLLVFYFFYEKLEHIPSFILHSADGEWLTIADYIATGFMLALSIAFIIGMEKYKDSGDYAAAVKKYSARYLALIGAGFLIVAIIAVAIKQEDLQLFNVLSAFGVMGLYSLFFIKSDKYVRLISGCLILTTYQFTLLIPPALQYVLANDFGGLLGAAAWCGMLLVAMFLAEVYREGNFKYYTITTAIIFVIGLLFAAADIITRLSGGALGNFFLASKQRASVSFLFITFAAAAAGFWLFARYSKNVKIPLLTWYGRSSLLCFVFAAGVGQGLSALANNFVTPQSIFFIFFGGCALCLALSAGFSYILYKHRIKI